MFFSPSTSVFPCQYNSTIAPHSSIHLPPTMYKVFLPVFQVSTVSIIPPLLHTHPSIYHPCCIKFFSPSTSVFPCQYHSTIAPHSSIHLPPTLYNVFLPVLQFSPVSNIPPLLHTHPSIYHPHFIMFLSQYFTFPLSVPFHHCSIPIHPSTTHTVFFFLPVLQFSPVSTIPPLLHNNPST